MKYLVSLGSCGCGGLFISRSWLWLSYFIQRLYLEHLQHCLGVTLTRLLRIYLSMCWSFRECLLLSLTYIQYSRCTAKCKHVIQLCMGVSVLSRKAVVTGYIAYMLYSCMACHACPCCLVTEVCLECHYQLYASPPLI